MRAGHVRSPAREAGGPLFQGRFIMRTNLLAGLEVRPGFDTYGGDAVFDASWRILRIERLENGTRVTYRPGEPRWSYAKFVFRSSVFTLVTVVDHLYRVHLHVANGFVQAYKTHLSAAHPLRRFLSPFLFQTVTVNDNARAFGPRNFALTPAALRHVWANARQLSSLRSMPYFGQMRAREPGRYERIASSTAEQHRHLRAAGLDLPLHAQGAQLANLFETFADGFLRQ